MGRFLTNLTFKYFLRLELDRLSSPKFLDTYTHECVHDIEITTHKIPSETAIRSTQLTEVHRHLYMCVCITEITHKIPSETGIGFAQLTEAPRHLYQCVRTTDITTHQIRSETANVCTHLTEAPRHLYTCACAWHIYNLSNTFWGWKSVDTPHWSSLVPICMCTSLWEAYQANKIWKYSENSGKIWQTFSNLKQKSKLYRFSWKPNEPLTKSWEDYGSFSEWPDIQVPSDTGIGSTQLTEVRRHLYICVCAWHRNNNSQNTFWDWNSVDTAHWTS